MVASTTSAEGVQHLRRHTPGWRVGTGLPVSLPPGQYAVTDEQSDGENSYLVLDETFRVRKRSVHDG